MEPEKPNLRHRRGVHRYPCPAEITLTTGRLFKKELRAKLLDISLDGLSISSNFQPDRLRRVLFHFPIGTENERLEITGNLMWVFGKRGEGKFRSGWRFGALSAAAKDKLKVRLEEQKTQASRDRRMGDRRRHPVPHDAERRKIGRRLADFLSDFDLFKPKGPAYRRNSKRRTDDRSSHILTIDNERRRLSPRNGERRALKPSCAPTDSTLTHSVKKLGSTIRDYFIFWLPTPIARKLVGPGSFAFISHPRDRADISRFHPFAKYLPAALIDFWLKWQWPVIGAEIKALGMENGKTSRGWLIFCPLTAEQMILNRDLARRRVIQTVNFAEKIGAKVVGLGAFTSIVTRDGFDVKEHTNIAVTSGNALSAATAVHNLAKAAEVLKRPLSGLTVGIVGAAGNVGSACSRAIYGKVDELILVDISKKALHLLCAELTGKQTRVRPAATVEEMRQADVVIAVTNAPGTIVRAAHLKYGAVVIDCAQPKNVSETIPAERPDVMVIESAILKLPRMECNFDIGSGKNEAPGCMAETIVLDALNWHKDYALGKLSVEQLNDIMAAARSLGLDIAHFRHSKGYVTESELSKLERKNPIPS